jgi:hypothetical protein
MTGDIRRRLDAIEAAFKARSTVLVQADGTQVVLPRAAALHAYLALNGLREERASCRAGPGPGYRCRRRRLRSKGCRQHRLASHLLEASSLL